MFVFRDVLLNVSSNEFQRLFVWKKITIVHCFFFFLSLIIFEYLTSNVYPSDFLDPYVNEFNACFCIEHLRRRSYSGGSFVIDRLEPGEGFLWLIDSGSCRLDDMSRVRIKKNVFETFTCV